MKEKSKKVINKYFNSFWNDNYVKKHGLGPKLLHYKNMKQPYSLFKVVRELISLDDSILDVGCGYGFLYKFLRNNKWQGDYTGIDFNLRIIEYMKKEYPKLKFLHGDILNGYKKKHDYVVCINTLVDATQHENNLKYVKDMIRKMFLISRKGVVFNVHSTKVDYRIKQLAYFDPIKLLSFCYELTNRVVLRLDYRKFEFMVYLFKNEAKGKFYFYKEWEAKKEKINWKKENEWLRQRQRKLKDEVQR